MKKMATNICQYMNVQKIQHMNEAGLKKSADEHLYFHSFSRCIN